MLHPLQKKWDEPWWQASAAAAASDGGEGVTAAAGSLGRLPGGGLLQPMQLPSRVKEQVAALAHPAERGGAAHTAAGSSSSSMALPLLEVQAGTAVESAAWEEARGSEDPLRELVSHCKCCCLTRRITRRRKCWSGMVPASMRLPSRCVLIPTQASCVGEPPKKGCITVRPPPCLGTPAGAQVRGAHAAGISSAGSRHGH